VAITGTLTTENLGIERLVRNTITNPNLIRKYERAELHTTGPVVKL